LLLSCHINADFCFSVASNKDSTVFFIFFPSKDSATFDKVTLSFTFIIHFSHAFTATAQPDQAHTDIITALSDDSSFSLLFSGLFMLSSTFSL
jgi:hypothetical protein